MNYDKDYLQAGYLFNKMASQVAAGATFEKDAGIQEIWQWLKDMYKNVTGYFSGYKEPIGAEADTKELPFDILKSMKQTPSQALAAEGISEEAVAAARADMERELSGKAEDIIMGGGETGTIPAALRAAKQSPRQSPGAFPFDLLSQMKKELPPGKATPGLSVEDLPGVRTSLAKKLQDLESRPSMKPGGSLGVVAPSDYDIKSALNLWGHAL